MEKRYIKVILDKQTGLLTVKDNTEYTGIDASDFIESENFGKINTKRTKKELLNLFKQLKLIGYVEYNPKTLLSHFYEVGVNQLIKHTTDKIIWKVDKYLLGFFIKLLYQYNFITHDINSEQFTSFDGHIADSKGNDINFKNMRQLLYKYKTNSFSVEKSMLNKIIRSSIDYSTLK
ncbi:MAG: hypothetical protein IAE93_06035 [Ignavibacteria bacterium]|nr:hypothetical protein [Ignavibacteria bacterium]